MLQPFMHVLNSQRIVLASSSPRRKQILENVNLKFEIVPSTFEENLDKSKYGPGEYVVETARHKTEDVASRLAASGPLPDLIIGADTVVSIDGEILEKPKDKEDAVRKLSKLSGNKHTVYTGVVLMAPAQSQVLKCEPLVLDGKYRCKTFVERTDVLFAKINAEIIEKYIETGEPMDKAGGYGIQAAGGTLVEAVHGCYFNVMGFPLARFAKELYQIYSSEKN